MEAVSERLGAAHGTINVVRRMAVARARCRTTMRLRKLNPQPLSSPCSRRGKALNPRGMAVKNLSRPTRKLYRAPMNKSTSERKGIIVPLADYDALDWSRRFTR